MPARSSRAEIPSSQDDEENGKVGIASFPGFIAFRRSKAWDIWSCDMTPYDA